MCFQVIYILHNLALLQSTVLDTVVLDNYPSINERTVLNSMKIIKPHSVAKVMLAYYPMGHPIPLCYRQKSMEQDVLTQYSLWVRPHSDKVNRTYSYISLSYKIQDTNAIHQGKDQRRVKTCDLFLSSWHQHLVESALLQSPAFDYNFLPYDS